MKRAKKEIMAMVIEEMKSEGDTAKPKGSKAEQASNTLLALVRGERKRGAASMLGVDLKKDATEFVPSRAKPAVETVLTIPGLGPRHKSSDLCEGIQWIARARQIKKAD